MSLSAIKIAVFDRLEAAPGLLPLFFDNVDLGVPSGGHLRPYIIPATTKTLGLIDLGQEIGLIQVSVFIKKGKGDIVAADAGQLVLDLFPRNLELPALRIDSFGSMSAPFYDGAWQITPVTIPYQKIC